jgi:hypothetical protein
MTSKDFQSPAPLKRDENSLPRKGTNLIFAKGASATFSFVATSFHTRVPLRNLPLIFSSYASIVLTT